MPGDRSESNAPHPKDVRNKWAIATLAAVAALIGAGGGVWGSLVVADKQITANRDLSSSQFQQEQRLKVYADVVTTMQDFQDNLISVRYTFNDALKGIYDEQKLSGVTSMIVDNYNAMRPKVAAVKLVGGKDVITAAEKLQQGFFDCLRTSYSLGYLYKESPVDASKVKALDKQFGQCEPKMQPLVDSYLTESREELGLQ